MSNFGWYSMREWGSYLRFCLSPSSRAMAGSLSTSESDVSAYHCNIWISSELISPLLKGRLRLKSRGPTSAGFQFGGSATHISGSLGKAPFRMNHSSCWISWWECRNSSNTLSRCCSSRNCWPQRVSRLRSLLGNLRLPSSAIDLLALILIWCNPTTHLQFGKTKAAAATKGLATSQR